MRKALLADPAYAAELRALLEAEVQWTNWPSSFDSLPLALDPAPRTTLLPLPADLFGVFLLEF